MIGFGDLSGIQLAGHILIVLALLVVTQDVQLFPKILLSPFDKLLREVRSLPDGVESIDIQTEDKKRLEIWRLPADPNEQHLPYVALIFHGNAGTVRHFVALQLWFSSIGITSYCFDYRGFGTSSGWPTENGFARDSDAVWKYVTEREQVNASQTIVLGYSVGGAPAARIASMHQPKVLVLLSAFSSLRQAATDQPIIGVLYRLLSPLLWWKLSTAQYITRLTTTNLVLAHGDKDKLVPPKHMQAIQAAYRGTGSIELITSPTSGHNDLFFTIRKELEDKVRASV